MSQGKKLRKEVWGTRLSDGSFEGEECRRIVKMTKWRRESPFIALEKALE
jgi:hypothetical protein